MPSSVPLAVGPVAVSPSPPLNLALSLLSLSLFLSVSFANVLHPAPAITSVTKLCGDLVCDPLLVHVLGIYGIRSRLRDTVPSLRFAATSQIRFVPSSDYFSAVPHSTDRPSFFSLSFYASASSRLADRSPLSPRDPVAS